MTKLYIDIYWRKNWRKWKHCCKKNTDI